MTEVILTDVEGNTLRSGIDVGGIVTPDDFMDPARNQKIFDEIQNFKYRDDDIMLCTFPKTGTNWMYELLSMINKKSAERVTSYKNMSMIECQMQHDIDKIPSPRVINSHLHPSMLPKDLSRCKTKTILCLRNPKDVATSFYHHIVGISHYGYTGTFACWLPLYLEGNLEDGKYTDYLRDWERAIDEGVEFPLHIIYYEDLKMDTERELNRLLKFLDTELSQTLKENIIDACSFQKMAAEKRVVSEKNVFREGVNLFFRKGQIGDWKNLFTVAQNEMFEGIWNKEMNESSMFKFIYTDGALSTEEKIRK